MAIIKYAFRLIHIQNIPHILKNGFVHKNSPKADPNFIPIGDTSVIAVRTQKIIDSSLTIGECIPFYFGPRSPMLYVIQHGYNGVKRYEPADLVYCIVLLDDIISSKIKCVFTDGHALNFITNYFDGNKLAQINNYIKFADVYASNWVSENDRDLKRRKEAELLLKDELPPHLIKGFITYSKEASEKLLSFGVLPQKIVVRPDYYF